MLQKRSKAQRGKYMSIIQCGTLKKDRKAFDVLKYFKIVINKIDVQNKDGYR